MANIARLGVVLGLNTAEFQTGLAGAMRGLDKLKTGVTVAAAAVVAAGTAFAYMTKQSINNMDALAKQAQMAGITVESLSGLSYAADLAGVSQETLTTSMARLAKGMSEAAQGTGEALKGFQALKLDVTNIKNADDALLQIAEKFAGFEDGAEKTALAISLFGRAGAQLIPFLNSGRDGIEQLRQEAEKLGIVIGTDTAKQAETFNDSLTRLGAIQTGIINQITAAMLPAFNAFTQALFDSYMNADMLRSEMGKLTSNRVPQWVNQVGFAFAITADGIVNTVKAIVAFIKILGAGVDAVNLMTAASWRLFAFTDASKEKADKNFDEANQKFNKSAEGIKSTLIDLKDNAFTFADAWSDAMMQLSLPKDDGDLSVLSSNKPKPPAPRLTKISGGKTDNMLAEAKKLSAEYERERIHSLNMLRIKDDLAGATANERRIQETVNEVLDATSKKLQDIADKREAAAGRDASAEVLAEYDKQALAIQQLGDYYVDLARRQEEASIASQQTFSFGWNQAFSQYAEDAENYAGMANDMFSSLTGAMSQAIDNFVQNGKFSFKDFASSVIKDLISIEMKMQAMQLFKAGLKAISGAVGMYSNGGFGTGNSFGNMDIGGFLAEGGAASAGTAYVVGERGPELFVPDRSGTVIPNHELGGGGVTNITNNYIDAIDTKSFEDRIYGSSRAVWAANAYANKGLSNNRSRT